MDSAKDQMNAPLPQEILQGNNLTKEEASKHIQTILRQTLPSSDSKNLKADFKWQFFLEQHYVVKLNRRKHKKTFLTRKQRKKMGLLKLPKENWKYSSLQVVRNMWNEYMRENLELIQRAPTCVDQDWNSFRFHAAELIQFQINKNACNIVSLPSVFFPFLLCCRSNSEHQFSFAVSICYLLGHKKDSNHSILAGVVQTHVIVAKSEMVGADLKVVKSKVPSLIGMHGTVVLETKMSFQIVTPQDKLKTILKETSVFEFLLDNMKFTFLGKHLMTRPSERSVKKIRNLMQPDL